MEKPRVEFKSRGPQGNVFYILGQVQSALRKQHRITDYNNLWEKVQKCESYKDALKEMREYVDLVDLDGIE